MPRTYVKRRLLTTLYRDLCSVIEKDWPAPPEHMKASNRPAPHERADTGRQLCFFPSDAYVGEQDGFTILAMPSGTEHEGWAVAVPTNRADRMRRGPTKALANGFVVRYPLRHYAYPIVHGSDTDTIETDDIQRELLEGLYTDRLPIDSVVHWVRVGDGHAIRVKVHGLHSADRRQTIDARVVMRDYWNDQFFNFTNGGVVFLDGLHATTKCRIVAVLKGEMHDLATDGSPKAEARAVNLGSEWFQCGCGYHGPTKTLCRFHKKDGRRFPQFRMRCPDCGGDCTPAAFWDMNRSIERYATSPEFHGDGPFPRTAPSYNILRQTEPYDFQRKKV